MAHPVDLFVDGRFLLDEGIGAGYIGLGLVIIIIGNEIFHRIMRKKAFEFAVELRGERLVGRKDQSGAVCFRDDLGGGEGFSGSRNTEQNLIALTALNAFDKFGNCVRLVSCRLILGYDFEAKAAFGFFRSGRAMRCPLRLADKTGITRLQQGFEGVHCCRRARQSILVRVFGG